MATPGGNVTDSGIGYIDGLLWGDKYNTSPSAPVSYYLRGLTQSWDSTESAAFQSALQQYSNVANINFTVQNNTGADLWAYKLTASEMANTVGSSSVLGFFVPPDSSDSWWGIGGFQSQGPGWHAEGLQPGGFGYSLLLHELGHAIGLAHPHDTGGSSETFTSLGINSLDTALYSVMSYNSIGESWNPYSTFNTSTNWGTFGQVATPMVFDIAAIQHIYGANMSFRTGDDTYTLLTHRYETIWDAGGNDTISAAGLTGDVTINLNGGVNFSKQTDGSGGYLIAIGAKIENAIGGNGNDTLVGNSLPNLITGGVGDDTLEGGSGVDIALFAHSRVEYSITGDSSTATVSHTHNGGIEGSDLLSSVELAQFADVIVDLDHGSFIAHWYLASNIDLIVPFFLNEDGALDHYVSIGRNENRDISSFDGFHYLASNPDLIGVFGANPTAAIGHYVAAGFGESRNTASFDGLHYLASNPDLIRAFGATSTAAVGHYVAAGFGESRNTASFDGLHYLASNPDLIGAFGANPTAAIGHYVAAGFGESRNTASFDGLHYLASNPGLIGAFGVNPTAAIGHYVAAGFGESRNTASFDGLHYLASNPDLIGAFGANPTAAIGHYVAAGFGESRNTSSFDGLRYIASNPDLIGAFGTNGEAAIGHYVGAGFGEGRNTTFFDPAAYLTSNADLGAAFGGNLTAALTHYITAGINEGRLVENITGTSGNDVLIGDGTNERLIGQGGNDTLTGGGGKDVLDGGSGSDVYRYTANSDSAIGNGDLIFGFDATDAAEDIALVGLLSGSFSFVGASSNSFAGSGNTSARFNDATDLLQIDTNGDAAPDMEITLPGVALADLDATDFTVS